MADWKVELKAEPMADLRAEWKVASMAAKLEQG